MLEEMFSGGVLKVGRKNDAVGKHENGHTIVDLDPPKKKKANRLTCRQRNEPGIGETLHPARYSHQKRQTRL